MAQENNKILDNNTVIHVDFKAGKAQKAKTAAADLSPEEIYALFAPRFGAEFTEWFVDQYKKHEA